MNGTRDDPPKPFNDVLNAAPVKGFPDTKIVGVAGCADAKVVICESCQLFNNHLAAPDCDFDNCGVQIVDATNRCR